MKIRNMLYVNMFFFDGVFLVVFVSSRRVNVFRNVRVNASLLLLLLWFSVMFLLCLCVYGIVIMCFCKMLYSVSELIVVVVMRMKCVVGCKSMVKFVVVVCDVDVCDGLDVSECELMLLLYDMIWLLCVVLIV